LHGHALYNTSARPWNLAPADALTTPAPGHLHVTASTGGYNRDHRIDHKTPTFVHARRWLRACSALTVMRAARRLLGMVGVGFVAVAAVGCAADEGDSDDWDEANEVSEIAVAGRWIPSASAAAAGDRQWSRYDDGPSWSGGRGPVVPSS
jgi:hypothetical protein